MPATSLRELLERRQPFVNAIVPGLRPRYFERSGEPFLDAQGGFAGFRGTAREVTDRVRAEVMASLADAAERASRSKSEFLARASHELRTPLHAILGFGELLLTDGSEPNRPTPFQRERLETMHAAGQRLLDLVNDMLDLARIEQGRFEFEPTAVGLRELVAATGELLGPLCSEHGVTVRNFILPDQPPCLADGRALGQVLLNLMSNAVKYNARHGIVTVRARTGDGRATLVVEDNGPGMTPEQLARLFEPFNRLGAEHGRTSGSGLGLVISKALVDRMGGSLVVESQAGFGTSATVVLPLAPVPAQAAAGDVAATDSARVQTQDAVDFTVVYVEDDPVNAMLMQQLFALEPAWRLHVDETGAQGIRLVESLACDAVLVDMNLPDMSGLDVLASLKARGAARCPCLALSADAMPEQIQRALAAGFDDYWTKPLDLGRARERLRRLQQARKSGAGHAGAVET